MAAKKSTASSPVAVFWFRRDLRLEDNAGLSEALASGLPVLPLFIFDTDILSKLEDRDDRRVTFLHRTVSDMDRRLRERGSAMLVEKGRPLEVFERLKERYELGAVYTNHDYEPYAVERDRSVEALCDSAGVPFRHFKDQAIFEKKEVTKDDGKPYTVFTPFSKKWKARLEALKCKPLEPRDCESRANFYLKWEGQALPTLKELGFEEAVFDFPPTKVSNEILKRYADDRNTPSVLGTSRLGLHLRFGTVSPRALVSLAREVKSETWLSELIWREFFMQILWNFPHAAGSAFRPEYDKIAWRNDEASFLRWCEGKTGYPIVDAGMRELNATGFMHNRVRMIAASFLVKHLMIDWRKGEAYFARKLLDFDLASNNGNWQWVAGSGCDAAPYFRIFNPEAQEKKFDPKRLYIKKWVPEIDSMSYPEPMVDHTQSRQRALAVYAKGLGKKAPAASNKYD